MATSNHQLLIRIRGIADNIPKIIEQAGSMLERNVRSNVRARLKASHKYPFEFQNDFQKPNTIKYIPEEQAVIVNHPAAHRLENGLGPLTITPKNREFLHFVGKDGEDVYTKEVTIAASAPLNYVGAAIKETEKDLAKKFKEVMNG